jgi:N-acetylmuramoyl-L-alanine amidase
MSVENIFIIDAGHGPETRGKRSPDGSLREFNFNHPTAQALITILNRYENVRTYTVYDTSRDTPLEERTDRANAIRARYAHLINAGKANIYYISIHANAYGDDGDWESARGIETYCMAPASDNPKGYALAKDVHRYLMATVQRYDRGVKSANFHVLRETKNMAAILVECGFMTHREENELLKSASYRQACAQGIANGLVAHAGLSPVKVASQTPQEAPQKEVLSLEPSETHKKAVEWAKENDISDGSNPREQASREQVMAMIYNYEQYRKAQEPDPKAEPFDVHQEAIDWAAENEITDGSSPRVDATRQQVVEMIYRDNKRKGSL